MNDIEPLQIPEACSDLNPKASEFRPQNPSDFVQTDITRFLLRKDLMLSRLTTFNDRPEKYQTWKASFCTV